MQPALRVRRSNRVTGCVQAANGPRCTAQRVFLQGIDWTRSIWPIVRIARSNKRSRNDENGVSTETSTHRCIPLQDMTLIIQTID